MFEGGHADIREVAIDMGGVSDHGNQDPVRGGFTDQADGGIGVCGGYTDQADGGVGVCTGVSDI